MALQFSMTSESEVFYGGLGYQITNFTYMAVPKNIFLLRFCPMEVVCLTFIFTMLLDPHLWLCFALVCLFLSSQQKTLLLLRPPRI